MSGNLVPMMVMIQRPPHLIDREKFNRWASVMRKVWHSECRCFYCTNRRIAPWGPFGVEECTDILRPYPGFKVPYNQDTSLCPCFKAKVEATQ